MSLDFFDDEFLEIPSIAPDLMFVEQDNPLLQDAHHQQQQQNQHQQPQQLPQLFKHDESEDKSQMEMSGLLELLRKEQDVQEKHLFQKSQDEQQDLQSFQPMPPEQLNQQIIHQQQTQQQQQQLSKRKIQREKLLPKQISHLKQSKEKKLQQHTVPLQHQDVQQNQESSSVSEQPVTLNQADRESLLSLIIDDHSYARPYPAVTISKECKITLPSTAMTILKLHPTDFPPKKKYKKRGNKTKTTKESDDEIDIMSVDKPDDMLVKYDTSRARHVMNEVEAYLNSLWKDVEKDEEEKISRGSWSKDQARLFDAVYKLINNYQLAKLSYAQNTNEPVLRKLALEKATKRVRKAFGSVMWNSKLIVWLHGIMIDGLCSSFFLCYLEILQSLKRKVPSLFERIFLNNKATFEKEQTAGLTNLGSRLRKSWEPAVGLHTKVTMEKFPIVPFLITIPCGPSVPHQSTKRNRFWNYQLMHIGKSVPINTPAYRTPEGYVVKHYLEHCISSVRSKTSEFSTRFSDRPVVLLGWDVGSIIALKIALLDKVDAVICLGFPYNYLEGEESEEFWNGFTKVECPILFILGSHATTNSIQRTEKLREKMKVYTNLIVMESGDELLRLTKSQKRLLGMTQNMIDKLIQDRIYVFLKSILFKPKSLFTQIQEGPSPQRKKKKAPSLNDKESDRKRKKGNTLKTFSFTSSNDNSHFALPPLDVSVPLHSESYSGQLGGLLTTGSISTPIPVTQLQSETLIGSPSSNVSQHTVISTDVTHAYKIGQKRSSTSKEKMVKKKVAKKSSVKSVQQNFTASLGNQAAGNLFGQRFPGNNTNKSTSQQTATLQRLPSGTFVLSGTSGNVRLQSGANIVYLQQLTSSGGTTKVIQSPLIANANGTFSAVPVVSNGTTITSASIVPTSSLINAAIGTKPKTIFLQQNTVNVASSSSASVTTALPQTKPANLILAASLPSFQPKSADANVRTVKNDIDDVTRPQQKPEETNKSSVSTMATTSLHSSLRNLMLALPNSQLVTAGDSASNETNEQTQSILHQFSQEEIKCLANFIGQMSNHPNSTVSLSPSTQESGIEPTGAALSLINTSTIKSGVSATVTKSSSNGDEKKSQLIALLDQSTPSSGNSSLKGVKKVAYPLSLTQKITSTQQPDKSQTSSRINQPRMVSNGTSSTKGNIASPIVKTSKQQKVPITITIPLSRLPSNLQLSTTNSKSISVPALSAYLAQQKFVLSTGKPSSLQSRTVLLSPSSVKKSGAPSATTKAMSVFATTKSSAGIKSPTSTTGRTSATITLHLPAQTALKDSLTLKKAASDIKLVGVLNQKSKTVPALNVSSAARSGAFPPAHKLSSPIDKGKNDLSSVQLRKSDISSEGAAHDQEVVMEGSVMNVIEENAGRSLSKEANFDIDGSDIDFAVTPSAPKVNKLLIVNSSPIISASKIIRVPVGQNGQKILSRTVLDVSKSKLSDTPLMNSARKVGAAFQKGTEVKALEQFKDSAEAASISTDISKLRFEPLGSAGSRPKLASVLSSMKETGKILVDESGQIRNTIIAKPTIVNSKTAAMIARNAFITDTKIVAKPSVTKPSVSTTTPALFTLGSIGSSGVISTPAATIRTANKVLPVTIKSSDFIRMSNQVRTNTNMTSKNVTKVVKTPIKVSEGKPKVKKSNVEEAEVESRDEPPPPPYITRSGRVLRTRFSYSDELDRKQSPKKRRRTNSTSKDETMTPTTPLANLGNALDSLVQAAKMITSEDSISVKVDESQSIVTPVSDAATVTALRDNPDPLANIDSTTNLAATAMLELLSSNASVNNIEAGGVPPVSPPIEAATTQCSFDNRQADQSEVTSTENVNQPEIASNQLLKPVQMDSTITQNTAPISDTNILNEQQSPNTTTLKAPEALTSLQSLDDIPQPSAGGDIKNLLEDEHHLDSIFRQKDILNVITSTTSEARVNSKQMLSPPTNNDGDNEPNKIEAPFIVQKETCSMKEE